MPFKLSADEKKRVADMRDKLTDARKAVSDYLDEVNELLAEKRAEVEARVATYNEALADARELTSGIATDAQTEFDDKSEKWQEGDKGQAASEWINTWEGADLDDIDIDFPADIDNDLTDHAEVLNELPDAADEG